MHISRKGLLTNFKDITHLKCKYTKRIKLIQTYLYAWYNNGIKQYRKC